MTARQKLENFITNWGLTDDEAKKVMDIAIPELNRKNRKLIPNFNRLTRHKTK